MASRITVIISETRSKHPAKRALVAAAIVWLMNQPDIDIIIVPNLYDLRLDSPALLALRNTTGPLVVISWLYPRAAHWTLHQLGISGRMELANERDSGGTETPRDPASSAPLGTFCSPAARGIYHIDFRAHADADSLAEEIRDKVGRCGGQLARPTGTENVDAADAQNIASYAPANAGLTTSRWYPVIDYDRCTNCMECIDFCLFGVYGINAQEMILVEQPDSCRKGCPACSRVCPENAIMFPRHKTPAIAGDPNAVAGTGKLNLSELFGGGPSSETAVRERDQHLHQAMHDHPDAAKPPANADPSTPDADALDALVDRLDELDL